jgi:CRP/FNR family cyclic AMP-dependent transcriptional regulator
MHMSLHLQAPEQRAARRIPGHRPRLRLHDQQRPSIERLANLTLFACCTHRQLTRIDGLSTRVSTDPGWVLIREGATAKEFYVIIDGRATVSVDGRALHTLDSGQSFGDIGLLDPGVRLATVTAATPMTLLVFGSTEFRDLLDVAPQIAVALLRNHVGRLRAAQAFAVGLDVEPESPAPPDAPSPRDERSAASLDLVMSV